MNEDQVNSYQINGALLELDLIKVENGLYDGDDGLF